MLTARKLLERVIEDAGWDAQVRSYSGRAMYGKRCTAVVSDERDIEWKLGVGVGRLLESLEREREDGDEESRVADSVYRLENSPRSDSMGLGVVVYWPRIEWDDSEPEKEPGADEEDEESDDSDYFK